jgi:hypothetical protein
MYVLPSERERERERESQVSAPYKAVGKIIVLYILIC